MKTQGPLKPRHLRVGINYPWGFNGFGTYFGAPRYKEGRDDKLNKWLGQFDKNLERWEKIGVSVVRIFLLCNLENFMTKKDGWQCPTPATPMDAKFSTDFTAMLETARCRNIQLIPSLVDFAIGEPRKLGGRKHSNRDDGRHRIVTDSKLMGRFYDATLEVFLNLSEPFSDTIYAWEVMNEPFWLTSTVWPGSTKHHYVVPLPDGPIVQPLSEVDLPTTCEAAATIDQVNLFLREGIRRIDRRLRDGLPIFQSTVGHRFLDDLGTWPAASGTRPQFHYYGRTNLLTDWAQSLGNILLDSPPHDPSKIPWANSVVVSPDATSPPFVGEFSARDEDEGNPWPWLDADMQKDRALRVINRLWELYELGYDLALVWPDAPEDETALDRGVDTKITALTSNGIQAFLDATHGT